MSPLALKYRVFAALLALLAGMTADVASDDSSPPRAPADKLAVLRREVAGLVRQLDSDQFDARQQAVGKLRQLKTRSEAAEVLAEEFHRALVSPDTPFEVRRQVERLSEGLPRVEAAGGQLATLEEIGRLVGQLEDNRYGVRLGATRRLEWFLESPKLGSAIYIRLKQRLAKPGLSLDARQWIEPICVKARGAWLTSDPGDWDLPAVAPPQIETWIDEVVRPAAGPGSAGPSPERDKAIRELRDLLARDSYEARVQQALEARLARGNLEARATRDLNGLIDLTRPAMVAEYWQGRRHLNTQHLVIGVPKREGQADRASHFDYVDDHTAFCVSGQNLSPGNHRVGIAFPHPKSFGAMFHLVNLTTPRHKMAYVCLAQGDPNKRLAQITRRTLEEFLTARQRLSLEELFLLEQLDPTEVSRFAGQYFLAVEDQAIPEEVADLYAGRPSVPGLERNGHAFDVIMASRHGAICYRLSIDGTKAAMPDLLTAVHKGRFLPPTSKAPHRLPWVAALAIALRDPWPGAEPWLAQLAAQTDALVVGRASGPELGATAAGILLAQHREEPLSFGLKETADSLLERAGLTGYRFATPEARQRVQQWWSTHHVKAL
jgi:hypothetical protein